MLTDDNEARWFGEGFFHYESALTAATGKQRVAAYTAASECFEKCVKLRPHNYFSWSNLGKCYFETASIRVENPGLMDFIPGTTYDKAVSALQHAIDCYTNMQSRAPMGPLSESGACTEELYRIAMIYMLARDPHGCKHFVEKAIRSANTKAGAVESVQKSELNQLLRMCVTHINAQPKKRFKVGDRVECKVSGGYSEGIVSKLDYNDENDMEDIYGFFRTCPYQVRLYDRKTAATADGQQNPLIFAPYDDDSFIRAAKSKPVAKVYKSDRKNELEASFLEITNIVALVKPLLKVPFPGLVDENFFSTFFRNYMMRVLARKAISYDEIDNSESGHAHAVAEFIGSQTIDQLTDKVEFENCAESALRLADSYQYGLQMGHLNRDAKEAARLYALAGEWGQPEGLIAVAILHFLHLMPPERIRAADFKDFKEPIPTRNYTMSNPAFEVIVNCLERAAIMDHCCPFLVLFAEEHQMLGDPFPLPIAIHSAYSRHKEKLTVRRKQDRVDRQSRCGFPGCTLHSAEGVVAANRVTSMSLCSRCREVGYCGREHQVADYKRHKKECNQLVHVGNVGIRSTDPMVQEAAKQLAQTKL